MSKKLRIVILEDRPTDVELIKFELNEGGIEFTAYWAANEDEYLRALREFRPDLILSDYDLPHYNGSLALAAAKKKCPEAPFILVTGAVGEDRAIEILTQGAMDYVLKHRLHRLVPAVRRALAEIGEQRRRKAAEEELRTAYRTMEGQVQRRTAELQAVIDERRRAEERLRENEVSFQRLYQSNPHPVFLWQRQAEDFVLADFNRAAKEMTGASAFSLVGKRASEIYPERKSIQRDLLRCFETKEVILREIRSRNLMPGKLLKTSYVFIPPDMVMVHAEDITARTRFEESLAESARHLRRVIDAIFPFVMVLAPDGMLLEVNRAATEAGGPLFRDCRGKKFWDCVWWNHLPEVQGKLQDICRKAANGEEQRFFIEAQTAGGRTTSLDFRMIPLVTDGRVTHLVASAVDTTPPEPDPAP